MVVREGRVGEGALKGWIGALDQKLKLLYFPDLPRFETRFERKYVRRFIYNYVPKFQKILHFAPQILPSH